MSSTQAERKTIFDSKTLTKKGLCPVTIIKDQASAVESHSLYYGVWLKNFTEEVRRKYYALWDITANRTSGMAEDVITLLDHIGWTEERQLHVVGISMGGMVAQELATRIPRRIVSLVLAVTSAGGHIWNNFPPDPAVKVQMIMDMVFPLSWLAGPSAADPKITNREAQTRLYMTRILATTPQTLMGTVSQMAAGLSHRVTPDRLRQIANDIPKIVLVTGDEDNLVPPQCSEWIKQCMGPNVKLEKWEQTGHALQIQRPERFNALVEKVIEESRAL
ncbi:hypothetical protein RhiTH_004973 [Rhizoctonia solani]